MTFTEILKAKGLSDKDVESVIGEMKQNKIFTAGEENLDIRYGKLKTDYESLKTQHGESTALIEQMKKDGADNAALQTQIADYEAKIAQLEQELTQAHIDSALQLALRDAKGLDVDYLAFKVKEKGELSLDKDGKIKGLDDAITALKTQYPTQFAQQSGTRVRENKLPPSEEGQTLTRSDILKMPYAKRQELAESDPETYNNAMNNERN